MKSSSWLYDGLRTRAMVWRLPAFLANMQQSRFSSSEPVMAIKTSVSSMPASFRVVMEEPLPTTPSTS